jgi:hypothetical protein
MFIAKEYSKWQHLHHYIEWIAEEQKALEYFSHDKTIHIASDGGYAPSNGISSFGWVVASDTEILSTGRGPAEAHPTLANSFRSEGYGAASALLFLTAYHRFHGIDKWRKAINIYIDNKSLVGRLSEHKIGWKCRPKHHMRPENDITLVAEQLLGNWDNVQIIHVKSHQSVEKELSWAAQLNNIADAQATEQRTKMTAPASRVTNTTKGMLYISGKAITRDAQQQLWQAASRVPIQEYLQHRNSWSDRTFNRINWKIQHKAINRFSISDQQRILKFVHSWMPTGKHLHREKETNSIHCPLCHNEVEDNIHIFNCQHPSQVRLQQELLLYIAKQQHGKEMPELAQLMEWAITNSNQSQTWQVNEKLHPTELQHAIKAQNKIGWQQIFYGRFALDFEQAQEEFYRWQGLPEITHNGQKWQLDLIQQIWKTMLSLWSNRNKAKHDEGEFAHQQNTRRQLVHRAQHCFKQAHLLSAADRNHLFQKPYDERICEDIKHLQAWVDSTEQIIRINKQEDPHIVKSRKKFEDYFKKKTNSEPS